MILGIYGAGGSGREIIEVARMQNKWQEIVFIDGHKKSDYPVKIMTFENFKKTYPIENTRIVISIGETKDRKQLREKIVESGYKFGNVIHPTAYISPEAKIGDGLIARANVCVSCGATIEENVQLFEGSTIGHDTTIGRDSIISTKACIGGNCIIGRGVYVGMLGSIKEKTTVGDHSTIGMGTAVFKDVDKDVIVLGNPGRTIRSNTDSKIFS